MTEYEHERQANIVNNQKILKSLNISILHKFHVFKEFSNMSFSEVSISFTPSFQNPLLYFKWLPKQYW